MTPDLQKFVADSRASDAGQYEFAAHAYAVRLAALDIIERQAKRIAELERELKEADKPYYESWEHTHRMENEQ